MVFRVGILFTVLVGRREWIVMRRDPKRASNFWSGCVHFHQTYDLCTFLYVSFLET